MGNYKGMPVTVTIGQQQTVILPSRLLRLRLTGMLFETNKSFLLPVATKGIRAVVDVYAQHPHAAVVVTGHTDRVGSAEDNRRLSEERAQAVAEYLSDDIDGWCRRFQQQPASSVWGTREDQYMLSAICDDSGQPFYDGPVTGVLDGMTEDAVRGFQRAHGLQIDGVPGPQTRRAEVESYMKLDGTTLPAGCTLLQLGCGESHNEIPTGDEEAEPRNRRVELFLFDPPPADPAVPSRCPGPGCPYETWKARSDETIDVDHTLCQLLVEVDSGGDRQMVAAASVALSGPVTRQQPTDQDGRACSRTSWPGATSSASTRKASPPPRVTSPWAKEAWSSARAFATQAMGTKIPPAEIRWSMSPCRPTTSPYASPSLGGCRSAAARPRPTGRATSASFTSTTATRT